MTMDRPRFAQAVRCRTQQGFTLIIVLIVLVAMMLAGISMMNSVSTASMVAGNMAFRQAAVHAGDVGTEQAIVWLQNHAGSALFNNIPASGYIARQDEPAANQTWDDYWRAALDPSPVARPVAAVINSGNVVTLPTDAATGTTVSYVIHRLCRSAGDPGTVECAVGPATANNDDDSKDTPNIPIVLATQNYYRITSRIEGPRHTVSYVQTFVML